MIDSFQELKLKILKHNLKQNWNLSSEFWNEEMPQDYMFEDTYLQLSFVFNTFDKNDLLELFKLTKDENFIGINKDLLIEINSYINSCVDFINYEIKGETKKYFKKFKKNSCFSYEKKIKKYLSAIHL
tara:strand:+ start:163 stop:546 length:384 start_codon:yes stop_codon:yes gene_type:complete